MIFYICLTSLYANVFSVKLNHLTGRELSLNIDAFSYDGSYSDKEGSTIYLIARNYETQSSRFISQDTYSYFNRYAAFNGEPISRVDPSGHKSIFKKASPTNIVKGISDILMTGSTAFMLGMTLMTRASNLGISALILAQNTGLDIAKDMGSKQLRHYNSSWRAFNDIASVLTSGVFIYREVYEPLPEERLVLGKYHRFDPMQVVVDGKIDDASYVNKYPKRKAAILKQAFSDYETYLYRGTKSTPEEIEQRGGMYSQRLGRMHPLNMTDRDFSLLIGGLYEPPDIRPSNTKDVGISTTRDASTALGYAEKGGYVYKMKVAASNIPIKIDGALQEVNVALGVRADQIDGYYGPIESHRPAPRPLKWWQIGYR